MDWEKEKEMIVRRAELARAGAQGEHKEEQAAWHRSAVGTGVAQPTTDLPAVLREAALGP